MNTVAAIMTEPDFAEVMFLVAFILFLLNAVISVFALVSRNDTTPVPGWAATGLLVAFGLAAVALGFLAL